MHNLAPQANNSVLKNKQWPGLGGPTRTIILDRALITKCTRMLLKQRVKSLRLKRIKKLKKKSVKKKPLRETRTQVKMHSRSPISRLLSIYGELLSARK